MKAKEESATQPKFQVSYKESLSMPEVVDELKFPKKIDQNVGSWRDA